MSTNCHFAECLSSLFSLSSLIYLVSVIWLSVCWVSLCWAPFCLLPNAFQQNVVAPLPLIFLSFVNKSIKSLQILFLRPPPLKIRLHWRRFRLKSLATVTHDRLLCLPLPACGLYYKPMTIVNDDARIINKLDASLTDDSRVVIYDRHMFIVQATGHR